MILHRITVKIQENRIIITYHKLKIQIQKANNINLKILKIMKSKTTLITIMKNQKIKIRSKNYQNRKKFRLNKKSTNAQLSLKITGFSMESICLDAINAQNTCFCVVKSANSANLKIVFTIKIPTSTAKSLKKPKFNWVKYSQIKSSESNFLMERQSKKVVYSMLLKKNKRLSNQ